MFWLALAADAVVVVHLLFILFALLGGLLVWRWHRLVWLHVPAAFWGGVGRADEVALSADAAGAQPASDSRAGGV